jgi:hypothetical protein
MTTRIFASAVLLLVFTCLALLSCSGSVNDPSVAESSTMTLSEDLDVTTFDSQTALLKGSGVNTDSANAFFVLRWSQRLFHHFNTDTVNGHAAAVAYEQPATLRDRNAVGLDMGTVSVVTGTDTLDLSKFESRFSGVRYGMFGGFNGGRPRHGGCDGIRDGRGGYNHHMSQRRSNKGPGHGFLIANVPFNAGGTYQFLASGADSIPALTQSIQAPSQLVEITGLADMDTVDLTQDLTVTWNGDPAATKMVLVIARGFKFGHFKNHGETVQALVQPVDPSAGSYTVPAQTVQDLLGEAKAGILRLYLSQSNVNMVNDPQLGTILVSAGSDDQVILKVK